MSSRKARSTRQTNSKLYEGPSTRPAHAEGVTHLFPVLHVLKHVHAVEHDGLQHFLVVVHAATDFGQIGQEVRQQHLVMLGEEPELSLGSIDPLV